MPDQSQEHQMGLISFNEVVLNSVQHPNSPVNKHLSWSEKLHMGVRLSKICVLVGS